MDPQNREWRIKRGFTVLNLNIFTLNYHIFAPIAVVFSKFCPFYF